MTILRGAMPYSVQALLDTGAGISTFNEGIALAIGITDLYSGIARPLGAASGTGVTGYIHPVTIEIWGRRLVIPIAFSNWNVNVLGMQGFFDQIRFGLDHASNTYYV